MQIATSVENADGLLLGVSGSAVGETLDDVAAQVDELARSLEVVFPIVVEEREPSDDDDHWCVWGDRCDNVTGTMPIGGCTLGIVLKHPTTDQRGISTAGHCSNNTPELPVRGWATISTSGNVATSDMSWGDEQDDLWYDMQIAVDSTGDAGMLIPSYHRDKWHGNRPITSTISFPPNGLQICLSGKNSEFRRCGPILDNDFDEGQNRDAVSFDVIGDLGDSGAPVTSLALAGELVITYAGTTTNNSTGVVVGRGYKASDAPVWMNLWEPVTVSDYDRGLAEHFVARLYRNGLQREASLGEVMPWAHAVDNASSCTSYAKDVIYFFMVTSGELNSVPNIQKVRRLYWTAFNRVPDSGGLSFWTGALDNGSWTWPQVVNHFVYSVSETTSAINGRVGRQFGPC